MSASDKESPDAIAGPSPEPEQTRANPNGAKRLAQAVLMFHLGGPWTDDDRAAWLALTGAEDATTRTLCDLARLVGTEKPPLVPVDDLFSAVDEYRRKAGKAASFLRAGAYHAFDREMGEARQGFVAWCREHSLMLDFGDEAGAHASPASPFSES
jgi:hypothetical protein